MKNEHSASAKSTNLPISTKHGIEIGHFLRFKTTAFAKNYLEDVIALKKAIPFRRHNRDVGHRKGPMAAGRYPQKAAKEFLKIVKAVEANANAKGLNTSVLKISKLIANKAASPMGGGRSRTSSKRTHLEIEVVEGKTKKKAAKKTEKKAEVKKEEPKVEKKVEPVKEAAKVEKKEAEVKEKPKVEEAPKKEEKVTEAKPEETKKEEAAPAEEPKVEEKAEEPAKEASQ